MARPSRTSRPARGAPVQPVLHTGGLEIRILWRYAAVGALLASCALISAWSRVNLIETSVALDETRAALSRASAEQERLQLELATLTDPHNLRNASTELAFEGAVSVIDVP